MKTKQKMQEILWLLALVATFLQHQAMAKRQTLILQLLLVQTLVLQMLLVQQS